MKRMVLMAALMAVPAAAHDAPSGWEYDRECCGGYDCAASHGGVREVQGGYAVSVAPGTHPMVPVGRSPVVGFVPHGDPRIRVSGDSDRHVCIVGGRVFCIYIPPGGV